MKIAAIALLALSLAGCCTPKTVYVDRMVEHRTEVFKPCMSAGDIPKEPPYAMAQLQPGAAQGSIILAMRQEIAQRADYQAVLVNILAGCTAEP